MVNFYLLKVLVYINNIRTISTKTCEKDFRRNSYYRISTKVQKEKKKKRIRFIINDTTCYGIKI